MEQKSRDYATYIYMQKEPFSMNTHTHKHSLRESLILSTYIYLYTSLSVEMKLDCIHGILSRGNCLFPFHLVDDVDIIVITSSVWQEQI